MDYTHFRFRTRCEVWLEAYEGGQRRLWDRVGTWLWPQAVAYRCEEAATALHLAMILEGA